MERKKGEWRDKRAEINKLGQHRIPGGALNLQLYAMTWTRSKGARVACRRNASRKARNADNSLPLLPRQRAGLSRRRGVQISRFVEPGFASVGKSEAPMARIERRGYFQDSWLERGTKATRFQYLR